MNEKIKAHLISGGVTFVSTFLLILGGQLQAGVPVQFNTSFIIGIVLVAVRAGVKAVGESYIFPKK